MTEPPFSLSKSILPLDTLFDNPVFAGGIGLAGLGAAAAVARKSLLLGASAVKRRLLVDIEISKQDSSYKWILNWLSHHADTQAHRPNVFIRGLTRVHHLSMRTNTTSLPNGSEVSRFSLEPGFGRHIIRHRNAYISVNREKHASHNHTTGEPHETVTLTTLYALRHVFEDVFEEAHRLAQRAQEGKTVVHRAIMTDWQPFGEPRRKRPLDSVILDEGIKERIVADVKDFIKSRQWYVDRGIPYRRGYLLYGSPGSGKTSFIQALAGELDFSIALVNLSEKGLTDDRLAVLLMKLPPRTILLLEDADAAFVNRRKVDTDGYSGNSVTFSGLLNALDGVAASEERIAFLTTNHIERLDPALIRAGRVDMTVRIGEATRYQAAKMWEKFYGDMDGSGHGRERFLQRLESLGLISGGDNPASLRTSTAAIQGLFQFNKDDVEGAIDTAEGLIPRKYEPETQDAGLGTTT